MNGPEHYHQAERDLHRSYETSIDSGEAGFHLAAAQVNATLALAAATVEVAEWLRVSAGGDVAESLQWLQVTR